jgi:anti-anti-sigma factor
VKLEISDLDNGVRLAKLVGRMDMKGTLEIDNEFALKIGSSRQPVLVDMEEVEFIVSLGMRTLISAARGVSNRGNRMVIFNPQALVKEALDTAGFSQLIPMYDELDEAIIALTVPN